VADIGEHDVRDLPQRIDAATLGNDEAVCAAGSFLRASRSRTKQYASKRAGDYGVDCPRGKAAVDGDHIQRRRGTALFGKGARMRRDAWFHSIVSGMSRDHILISCITREGEILNALKRNLPNVRAVHVPHKTCGAFLAIVSMKKVAEGEPRMAMLTALGTELYTKQVIVVDEDVDIYDLEDVMWAVATRVKAEKDVLMVPGVKAAIIDPTSDPATFTVTKMGIDATAPINEEFAERLIISPEQRSRPRYSRWCQRYLTGIELTSEQ
jgi:hypothetical protein